MDGDHPGRTFISYSRRDGADFTRDLRATLKKENLSVWQDLVALEGGQDWWSQIENALRSRDLHHSILVVMPKALESAVVKQEIRLDRQEGKSVCPIRGPGVIDLNKTPRWLGHVYDLHLPEQKTALVSKLRREAEPRRAAMMAPKSPADFVARPKEFDALKARLLDPEGDSVAGITAAPAAMARRRSPKRSPAIPKSRTPISTESSGPNSARRTLSDLVTLLSGEPPQLETIHAAAAKLAETLGDRMILMVVDDVWRKQDLEPFLQGGRHCVRLVTTRIDSVLPPEALRQKLDAMLGGEAQRVPRLSASKAIRKGFRPFACCRTGVSPRVLMTTRSGCGI